MKAELRQAFAMLCIERRNDEPIRLWGVNSNADADADADDGDAVVMMSADAARRGGDSRRRLHHSTIQTSSRES